MFSTETDVRGMSIYHSTGVSSGLLLEAAGGGGGCCQWPMAGGGGGTKLCCMIAIPGMVS